jgi:hypothetical protein
MHGGRKPPGGVATGEETLDLGRRLVNGSVKVFSRGMTTDSVDEYRV